jgi:hypothetical protein
VTAIRTLPEHATCTTHEHYLLSCADYEELLGESGGKCQICGFPASAMPQKRLYIDHEGHLWGVRGLLCIRCNSALGDWRQGMPDGTDDYLANSWYVRKLAERGLSLEDPEPAVGSIVQDYRGTYWHHADDDRWTSLRSAVTRSRTWEQMCRLCGPLCMRVVCTWDGRDWLALDNDLPRGPRAQPPPTRAVLGRRVTNALALVESHEWCPKEQEAVSALITALTGS